MDLDKILSTVIPSKDMRNHLLNGGLERSCSDIEEIIFNSPISMDVKYELLKEIEDEVRNVEKNKLLETDSEHTKEHKLRCYDYRMDRFESYLATLQHTLEHRKSEGIFVCETGDYEEDVVEIDIAFEYVCGSFDEAVEWIKEDIKGGEYTPEDTHWHRVSLWQKNASEKYEETCSYEFINGIACYSELSDEKIGIKSTIFDKQINLEVPFKAGDIIEVNAVPYAPKYRALVTHIDDNRDCCAVQVLTLGGDGYCHVGGLKHNHVALEVWGSFSPLYTASIYKGGLSGEEAFLSKVSEYINGDEIKGEEVCHYFSCTDKTCGGLPI